jgi:rhamnosyl/mannosyltransferase
VRILHVFKDAYPPTVGGIEMHVHDVTQSLDGFESTVLTSSRSARRRVDHVGAVRIVRAPELGRLASTPLTPSWRREIRSAGADLLHVHMPNPGAELALLTLGADAAMVATFHADVTDRSVPTRAYGRLQQRFLARAAAVVAASPMLAASPPLTAHRGRVVVVPYGVDAAEWPAPDEDVARLRARHPGPLVLFLGRLVHYKGLDVLVDAMRSVDATLFVVGEGPQRSRLQRQVARSGLGRRVVLEGLVANERRATYYRAADVFVLPSTSGAEAFGMAMLEAMALGTPAVCTEVGTGTSWVNRHGATGLVVPPGDARSLAEAIRRLLRDEPLRRDLAAGAADRARRQFSKAAMLDALGDLYREAGSPGRAGPTRPPIG